MVAIDTKQLPAAAEKPVAAEKEEVETVDTQSVSSGNSARSAKSGRSAKSVRSTASIAQSAKSTRSTNSKSVTAVDDERTPTEDADDEVVLPVIKASPSTETTKSVVSTKSAASKSSSKSAEAVLLAADGDGDDEVRDGEEPVLADTPSIEVEMSNKSSVNDNDDKSVVSTKSGRSIKSVHSTKSNKSSVKDNGDTSVVSTKSGRSIKSFFSSKSDRSKKSVVSTKSGRSIKSFFSSKSDRSKKSVVSTKSSRSNKSFHSTKSNKSSVKDNDDKSVVSTRSGRSIKSFFSSKSDRSKKSAKRSGEVLVIADEPIDDANKSVASNKSAWSIKSMSSAKSGHSAKSVQSTKADNKSVAATSVEERVTAEDANNETILPIVIKASSSTETAKSAVSTKSAASKSTKSSVAELVPVIPDDADVVNELSADAKEAIATTKSFKSVDSTMSNKSLVEPAPADDVEPIADKEAVPSVNDDDSKSLVSTKSSRSIKSIKSLLPFKSARLRKLLRSANDPAPVKTIETVTSVDSTKSAFSTKSAMSAVPATTLDEMLDKIAASPSTDTASKTALPSLVEETPLEVKETEAVATVGMSMEVTDTVLSVEEVSSGEPTVAASKVQEKLSEDAVETKPPLGPPDLMMNKSSSSKDTDNLSVQGKTVDESQKSIKAAATEPVPELETNTSKVTVVELVEANLSEEDAADAATENTEPTEQLKASIWQHLSSLSQNFKKAAMDAFSPSSKLESDDAATKEEDSSKMAVVELIEANLSQEDAATENTETTEQLKASIWQHLSSCSENFKKATMDAFCPSSKLEAVDAAAAAKDEDSSSLDCPATVTETTATATRSGTVETADQKSFIERNCCGLFLNIEEAAKEVFHQADQLVAEEPASVEQKLVEKKEPTMVEKMEPAVNEEEAMVEKMEPTTKEDETMVEKTGTEEVPQ